MKWRRFFLKTLLTTTLANLTTGVPVYFFVWGMGDQGTGNLAIGLFAWFFIMCGLFILTPLYYYLVSFYVDKLTKTVAEPDERRLFIRSVEFILRLGILIVGVIAAMFVGFGVTNEIEVLSHGSLTLPSYFVLFTVTFGLFALAYENIHLGTGY